MPERTRPNARLTPIAPIWGHRIRDAAARAAKRAYASPRSTWAQFNRRFGATAGGAIAMSQVRWSRSMIPATGTTTERNAPWIIATMASQSTPLLGRDWSALRTWAGFATREDALNASVGS